MSRKNAEVDNSELIDAVKVSDAIRLRDILRETCAGVDVLTEDKRSPLYEAVHGQHESDDSTGERLKCVRLLLEAGARPSRQIRERGAHGSALNLAINVGDFDVANLLLDFGADGRVIDSDGRTAVHYLVSRFRFTPPNAQPQVFAAIDTMLERLLAKWPVLVNQADDAGMPPLMRAIGEAPPAFVQRLVALGADVRGGRISRTEPIHRQWSDRDLHLLNFLLDNGADINARGADGCSPLFNAADVATAQAMIDRGADVHAVNRMGQNILCYRAVNAGWDDALYLFFLANGVSPDQPDYSGNTAVMRAEEERPDVAARMAALLASYRARNTIREVGVFAAPTTAAPGRR